MVVLKHASPEAINLILVKTEFCNILVNDEDSGTNNLYGSDDWDIILLISKM